MKIYIAGPDVFRPDAAEHFDRVRRACSARGHTALCPVDGEPTHDATTIYRNNVALIHEADAVIANLNPFRGPEPDSGTVWEVGYACALDKTVIAYVSDPDHLIARVQEHYPPVQSTESAPADCIGHAIENVNLPLNLMIPNSAHAIVVGSFEEALSTLPRAISGS